MRKLNSGDCLQSQDSLIGNLKKKIIPLQKLSSLTSNQLLTGAQDLALLWSPVICQFQATLKFLFITSIPEWCLGYSDRDRMNISKITLTL